MSRSCVYTVPESVAARTAVIDITTSNNSNNAVGRTALVVLPLVCIDVRVFRVLIAEVTALCSCSSAVLIAPRIMLCRVDISFINYSHLAQTSVVTAIIMLFVVMRERFKEFKDLSVEDRKAFIGEFKNRREQIREDFKTTLEQVREQYKADKERIKELREQYKDERKGFIDARDDLREQCKRDASAECKKARGKLAEEGKGFMGNSAEQMLRIIGTMKTRVQTNANIDDTTAASIVLQLDERAAAIEDAKEAIDALTNESTVNETKAAAESLRTAWKEARVTIRLTEGLIVHAKFQEFINHLNAMDVRFKEASDALAADGKDVAELNAAIDGFEAEIDSITASYQQAKDSYLDAMDTVKTEAEANALLKSTHEQLKAVREDAGDVRDSLRNVLTELRGLDVERLKIVARSISDDTASDDVDVEVETEIEAEAGSYGDDGTADQGTGDNGVTA